MRVTLKTGFWGGGCRCLAAAGEGSGGATADNLDELIGSDAKEAIFSLGGNFAEGQLPDVEAPSFPGPLAEEFYWSNADLHFIQGPVGSGKTTTLLKMLLRRAVEMPRSSIDGVRRYKVLFIRETYRQIWQTTIPSYLEVYPRDMGEWSGGKGNPVTHVIRFRDEWGEIEFIAEFGAFGDNVVQSLRGYQATDIVLNEMDTMPVEVLTVGIGRIDRYPGRQHFAKLPRHLQSYGRIVGDMNAPEDEDQWSYKVTHDAHARESMAAELTAAMQADEDANAKKAGRAPEKVKPIEIKFTNQPGYEQPGCENLHNLSASYYPRQIATNRLAGRSDMTERLVYNRVTVMRVGDPVFEAQFNRRVHVSEGPLAFLPDLPLLIGLDQGFKGAAIIAQRAGYFRWRFLRELHFPHLRLLAADFGKRLADLIAEEFPNAEIECGYGDMAGEHGSSNAADENDTWNLLVGRAAGFDVRPQIIGQNRIQPRLEAVRAALEAPLENSQPGLLIDPSCKFLKRGFEARYVWTEEVNMSGDKRKIPDKRYTEANVMDAGQYLLLSGHDANGLSPYVRRDKDNRKRPDRRNGRTGRGAPPTRGLEARHDVLNPYGDA
ncbi:MAG: hypothetical protein AAF582_00105 [Pseudomonadota bacterium]